MHTLTANALQSEVHYILANYKDFGAIIFFLNLSFFKFVRPLEILVIGLHFWRVCCLS